MSSQPKVFERPSLSGPSNGNGDYDENETTVCIYGYDASHGCCKFGYFECGWLFDVEGVLAGGAAVGVYFAVA